MDDDLLGYFVQTRGGPAPLLFEVGEDLFGGRRIAAHAAEEFDGHAALEREAHVVDQLPGAELYHGEGLGVARERPDLRGGKWEEGNRAEQAGADAAGARQLDDGLQDPPDDAVTHENKIGVAG